MWQFHLKTEQSAPQKTKEDLPFLDSSMFSSTPSLMNFNFLGAGVPPCSEGELCRLADVKDAGDSMHFVLLLPPGDGDVLCGMCRHGLSMLEGMGNCSSFHFSTKSSLDLIIANFSEVAVLFH